MATFPFLSSLDQVRFTSTDPATASAALAALPVLGIDNVRRMSLARGKVVNRLGS